MVFRLTIFNKLKCLVDSYRIPRFGLMEFDEDDVEVMIATGVFNNVILHEMVGVCTLLARLG